MGGVGRENLVAVRLWHAEALKRVDDVRMKPLRPGRSHSIAFGKDARMDDLRWVIAPVERSEEVIGLRH